MVLSADPANLKALALAGVCEKRLGDPAAERHLNEAFARLGDAKLRMAAGVELEDLYMQRGESDKALPVMQKLVELNPENSDILFAAQQLYQQMADETLNKLALVAPGSARMQQAVAEHLVNSGDLKGAAEHYRAALRLDNNLTGAHFELAEAIVEAAPHDAAAQAEGRKELEAALRIDGDNPRTECELAHVAYLAGQLDLALAHYERAYALNTREVEAQLGIGRILVDEEKPAQALTYLKQAVAQDPLNAEARYRYARALTALHRDEEARREMSIFATVRDAHSKVRELYMQMNKRSNPESNDLPPAGSLP